VVYVLNKKVFIIVTNKKKKCLIAIAVFLLVLGIVNILIYPHYTECCLEGNNIIIDPGHGGIDGGTTDNSSLLEKNINLQIAKELKKTLESKKAFVSMTRETDIALDYQNKASYSRHERDLIARVTQFNSGKFNLFVSIHVNRSSSSKAIGPMVLYSSRIPESILLAECIQSRLNDHIKHTLNKDIERLPIDSDFYILKNSDIPGVLVETGFMSNSTEKELLIDKSYQSKLATVIANGIEDYLQADKSNLKVPSLKPPSDDDRSEPYDILNEVELGILPFLTRFLTL
jgi:N-acetylmuramoyl-L-alanine amidase